MTSANPSPSQFRVGPACLQSLPPELKLMIMKRLHNKPSLRNLIQASATFREVYRNNDEAIYTAITIRSLARRGFDVFTPVNALEFYILRNTWSKRDIARAVKILYTACQQNIRSGHDKDSVRFPVHVCTVALHILHAVAYKLPNVENVGAKAAIRRFKYSGMCDLSSERYPYGYQNYGVIKVVQGPEPQLTNNRTQ